MNALRPSARRKGLRTIRRFNRLYRALGRQMVPGAPFYFLDDQDVPVSLDSVTVSWEGDGHGFALDVRAAVTATRLRWTDNIDDGAVLAIAEHAFAAGSREVREVDLPAGIPHGFSEPDWRRVFNALEMTLMLMTANRRRPLAAAFDVWGEVRLIEEVAGDEETFVRAQAALDDLWATRA